MKAENHNYRHILRTVCKKNSKIRLQYKEKLSQMKNLIISRKNLINKKKLVKISNYEGKYLKQFRDYIITI